MIRNYLLTAFRNLNRNKVFSGINILGLALGMACSLLIMLWVQDEKKMDAFHAEGDRIYAVYQRQFYDGKIESGYFTPGNLGAELKRIIPEIEYSASKLMNEQLTFQVGDKIIKETGGYAGEDFFSIFSFPLLNGKASLALTKPESIAISKKMAEQFFGSAAAAMGKAIRCENKKEFNITAVFDNVSQYSSMKFEYIINWHYYQEENGWTKDWGNSGPAANIRLKANADPAVVRTKIRKFLDAYNKQQNKTFYVELGIQPFQETYLNANFKNGKISGGRVEYVRLFSIVAVFILLIACINFMNLTTARSAKRGLEIGIRKVVGAQRSNLQRQFLGEAILLALFAAILSLLIVVLVLPAFNELTQKEIALPYTQFSFWALFCSLAVGTGVVSGSYPALFLSSFNPIRVLKGSMKFSTSSLLFRKGLVIFQFALSILLIIGTIIVSQQVNMIQTRNLGYEKSNLLYIPLEGELRSHYDLFKEEALKMPGVQLISSSTENPTDIGSSTGSVDWDGKDPNVRPEFTHAGVGYDFVKTIKATMVSGRDFSKDFATDSTGFVINETAAKKMGMKHAVGQRLSFWDLKGTIIGVVKDFHFSNLHLAIKPIIFRMDRDHYAYWILARTEPGKTKEALASLEKVCKKINPNFPFSYQFSDQEYQKAYKSEDVIGKLSNYFAFLAIFISCLGLLGLAMFTAEQRMKEMGIRKVLGASAGSLFGLLTKEFLYPVIYAILIAVPIAWLAMNQWLQNYEYRVSINMWVFVLAGLLASLIALFTISFQAIKAALANPVTSLRAE